MVGDYLLQNDWMSKHKVVPFPDEVKGRCEIGDSGKVFIPDNVKDCGEWDKQFYAWMLGHLACTVHCTLYTLAVFLLCAPLMIFPDWFYLACFVTHWPVDRFRLAKLWMNNISGQKVFADKMAPWSVIVVDNTYHLLTLYVLALLAGVR